MKSAKLTALALATSSQYTSEKKNKIIWFPKQVTMKKIAQEEEVILIDKI